jgi:predicted RNA-binding protein YlxR (DUF448 family)
LKNIRTCICCKVKNEKEYLNRIVSINKLAIYDESQNINSRAIYICKDKKCIDNILKILIKGKYNNKLSMNTDSLKNVLESIKLNMGE